MVGTAVVVNAVGRLGAQTVSIPCIDRGAHGGPCRPWHDAVMALTPDLAAQVDSYARKDLPGDEDQLAWHVAYFDFLQDDPALQARVGEEFFTARYLYKLWEGLRLQESWAGSAQVRLQVLQYASIYEACLHHLLFVRLRAEPEMRVLLWREGLKRQSVPSDMHSDMRRVHANRDIIPAVVGPMKRDDNNVRFSEKVDVAVVMELIAEPLGEELKAIYTARNSIHLHAEVRRETAWDLANGVLAYRRMQPFCEQLRYAVAKRFPTTRAAGASADGDTVSGEAVAATDRDAPSGGA